MLSFHLLSALALSTLAFSAPTPNNDGKATKSHAAAPYSNKVFDFTSTYIAYASPDQVRFENITVYISGNYSSPAKTATHIHEAAFGRNGPPRIAFPNPTIVSPIDEFGRRVSIGCLTGPFTTGLAPNGTDTGLNFSLAQIERNPPGFFTDVHTAKNVPGAIRGQLELTGIVS